ncbi:protein of unknown function [Cupriavidus taiwanensis]|nr:hypothetical protein CBM2606_A90379 [Cupriavidus taiwanensis]SPA41848.1 protein of unknown function [Cupriavidus taiwanensis]
MRMRQQLWRARARACQGLDRERADRGRKHFLGRTRLFLLGVLIPAFPNAPPGDRPCLNQPPR